LLPVTVYVTPFTRFGGGLTSPGEPDEQSDEAVWLVIGTMLKDALSGQPVFVARSVTELPN
jgi:hypothetical protein